LRVRRVTPDGALPRLGEPVVLGGEVPLGGHRREGAVERGAHVDREPDAERVEQPAGRIPLVALVDLDLRRRRLWLYQGGSRLGVLPSLGRLGPPPVNVGEDGVGVLLTDRHWWLIWAGVMMDGGVYLLILIHQLLGRLIWAGVSVAVNGRPADRQHLANLPLRV